MFYDIFCALCDKKGVSKTRATLDVGLSNATATKWKKTDAAPDSSSLSKLASYFGVTVDFLLGLTPEGLMLGTKYRLAKMQEQYEKETDPAKREELALQIDGFQESLEDQRLAARLSEMGTKKAPTDNGERKNDARAALFGDKFALMSDKEKDYYWEDARSYFEFKFAQDRKKND